MKLPIDFSPDAKYEYDEAHARYRATRKGLAPRFRKAVNRCLKSIQRFPLSKPVEYPPDLRRSLVEGFPYLVIYRVTPTSIRVISVFHTSRDPSNLQRLADESD
jgi:plasmid stabilization system protein ParE